MTDLDLLEQQYGKVTAYDGRSVFWTNLGVFDIRDAAKRLKVGIADVADAMPEFAPAKRGRRSAAVSEEKDESEAL
jgi:hypothetical protein